MLILADVFGKSHPGVANREDEAPVLCCYF